MHRYGYFEVRPLDLYDEIVLTRSQLLHFRDLHRLLFIYSKSRFDYRQIQGQPNGSRTWARLIRPRLWSRCTVVLSLDRNSSVGMTRRSNQMTDCPSGLAAILHTRFQGHCSLPSVSLPPPSMTTPLTWFYVSCLAFLPHRA
jgi:hypothetical protein